MRYFRNAQRSPRNTGRADGCERGRAGSKSRRLLVSTGGGSFGGGGGIGDTGDWETGQPRNACGFA